MPNKGRNRTKDFNHILDYLLSAFAKKTEIMDFIQKLAKKIKFYSGFFATNSKISLNPLFSREGIMRLTLQSSVMLIACTLIIAGQVQRMMPHEQMSSASMGQTRQYAASPKNFGAPDLQGHNVRLKSDENAEAATNNGAALTSNLSQNPSIAPSYDGSTVKLLHAKSNGSYNAPVSINGVSMVMLVDTGASFVSLTQDDAKAIGIWPMAYDYNVPVSTANGQVMAARGMIPSLQIDSIRINDIACLILPREALQQSLLGLSFLNRLKGFSFENGNLVLRQ